MYQRARFDKEPEGNAYQAVQRPSYGYDLNSSTLQGMNNPKTGSLYDSASEIDMACLSLNPSAKEFVPPGKGFQTSWQSHPFHQKDAPSVPAPIASAYDMHGTSRDPGFGRDFQDPWKRQSQPRRKAALQRQYGGNVQRTIYICDVDHQVTEASLADVFKDSGKIVDCRVCGDPNSAMRFAFIEFADERAVQQAIKLNGAKLGKYPIRVMPSKTAIVPVNTSFLPRTQKELECCARTVYVANIDKRVDREDVRQFFETLCGPVKKIRLLSDYNKVSSIAFVEFAGFESARKALDCSGALLGMLPIRVTPSKAPVRDEY